MTPRAIARRLSVIMALGNLLGALLTFFYFRMIDPVVASGTPAPGRVEIAFLVVGVGLLSLGGYRLSDWWSRPIYAPEGWDPSLVRRRAVLFPYAVAGVTLVGWSLAGLVWGVGWPLLVGVFSVSKALRQMFGITGIAGSVATAFAFFAAEHQWRQVMPLFFPDGDLSAVRGVPRLPVRARLRIIFVLTSAIPLSLLGVLALTSAQALMRVDRVAAAAIVESMVMVVLFITGVGVIAAAGLSVLVARSVSVPLRELERAMGEVARGDLERRCAVVTNDEIGSVTEGFNRMLQGLRERERIRETFGKYVTREIRDEILGGRISLDGQVREVTMLFADLRDFTPWVEATDPREVVHDLNAYFTEMERAIRAGDGLVLQFIGDEIEAVFGAPAPHPDHAGMAILAALDMRRRLEALNADRARAAKPALRHGIGIHTGTVLAGNIGSAERLSYALVGDAVNLASRIQDLTKQVGADILVSAATRRRLDGRFPLVELPALKVKGKAAEVEVYRVL
jgi:adenylate cyclase